MSIPSSSSLVSTDHEAIHSDAKIQNQRQLEEKTDWEVRVKEEYPQRYIKALAAVKTAQAVERKEEKLDWKLVYDVCEEDEWEIPQIFSSFCSDTSVQQINAVYRQLKTNPRQALPFIYYLDQSNNCYREDLERLFGWLEMSECHLTFLGLGWSNIYENAELLAGALKHANCTSIGLWNNKIGDLDVVVIAEALKDSNCKLISIDLGGNEITEKGVMALAEVLEHPNCNLTSVNLRGNVVKEKGTIAIAEALKHPNCKLISIYLSNSGIGKKGVIAIAEALKHPNCKLTSITLSGYYIGDAGAMAIAEALKHANCKLTSINLGEFYGIGISGAKTILQAVALRKRQGRKIKVVGINELESIVARAEKEEKKELEQKAQREIIRQSIANNSATEVKLANRTVITDLPPIFTALNVNRTVTRIDFSDDSEIDGRVIEPLMQVLSGNYGWGFLARTFSTPTPNATLTCIDLRNTKVSRAEAETLFAHVKSLKTTPPRTRFSILYSRGEELKLEAPSEEKVRSAEQKAPERTALLQTLSSPSTSVTTSDSSCSITSRDPLLDILEERIAANSEFQGLDIGLQSQALVWINSFYHEKLIKLREGKGTFDIDQLINECINAGIRAVKQFNGIDTEEKKACEEKKSIIAATSQVIVTSSPGGDAKAAVSQLVETPRPVTVSSASSTSAVAEEIKAEEIKAEEKKREPEPDNGVMAFFLNSARSLSGAARSVVGSSTDYLTSFFASQAPKGKDSKETKAITSTDPPLEVKEIKDEELLRETVASQIGTLRQEIARQTDLIGRTRQKLVTTDSNVGVLAVSQSSHSVRVEEQERVLQEQEAKLRKLEAYVAAKERFSKERDQLLSDRNPSVANFYNCFRRYLCAHLHTFYLAQAEIFEQKLGAASALKDKNNLRSVASKIGTATLNILSADAISAIPLIGSSITSGAKLGIRMRDNSTLTALSRRFFGFMPSTFEDLAHVLAQAVTQTYQEQIKLLTPEGAARFAECGVIKIISAILNDQINEDDFVQGALATLRTMEVSQAQANLCGYRLSIPLQHQRLETERSLADFKVTEDMLYRQTGVYVVGSSPSETKYYSNDAVLSDREGGMRPPMPECTETFASHIGYIRASRAPTNMVQDRAKLGPKRASDSSESSSSIATPSVTGNPPVVMAVSSSQAVSLSRPSVIAQQLTPVLTLSATGSGDSASLVTRLAQLEQQRIEEQKERDRLQEEVKRMSDEAKQNHKEIAELKQGQAGMLQQLRDILSNPSTSRNQSSARPPTLVDYLFEKWMLDRSSANSTAHSIPIASSAVATAHKSS